MVLQSKTHERAYSMRERLIALQAEITQALRSAGADVLCVNDIGEGYPNLVVGYCGINYLVEISRPDIPLSDDQKLFATAWRGQVKFISSVNDAFKLIGVL